MNGLIVNPAKPYSFADVFSDSVRLSIAYPDIVTVKTVGFSVEKRNILLLALGRGEAKALLCGAHHGREYITAAYLMKMAEEAARLYQMKGDPDGTGVYPLLNAVSLHIVPMVNPDGVEICQSGFEEDSPLYVSGHSHRTWKANANGVDLNRQYPCLWDKLRSFASPAPEGYKGEAPATEPEVRAVMKLCLENAYSLAASFHTKGEEIYWADSLTRDRLPMAKKIAKRLSEASGYSLKEVSRDPALYGGGFENWFRFAFERPAFLIELTPYDNSPYPHLDGRFESLVWRKAKKLGLVLAEEALKI